MTYKKTNYLTEDARKIRQAVFVEEQGFTMEFDDIDNTACHVVFYDESVPAAVCRYYAGEEEGEFIAGRIAIRKEYRGRQLGRYVMEVLEELIRADGGKKIVLSAQARAQGFYEKSGFAAVEGTYMDEFCPHMRMEKMI